MTYLRRNTGLISVLLSILILTAPLMAQQTENSYAQGLADGEKDGWNDANPLWIVAGLGCGCIGIGAAYLITPSVPSEKIIGKSSDYVLGYSDGYKKNKRTRQALFATLGWLIWCIIYLSTDIGTTA